MFGKPEDVEGKCNARMYLGDDHGDNHTTIICNLPEGHLGRHQEMFKRAGKDRAGKVTINWDNDESYHCPKHGHVEKETKVLCRKCYRELPDCPDCEGVGAKEIETDKWEECKKCDGDGKLING
jgi:hypothetical protein